MAFPKFTEGAPKRPDIHHDHGFLDDGKGNIDASKRESPTWKDYRSYYWWKTKLEGAEVLRKDLKNATDAYRHFLVDADGKDFDVDYNAFLNSDDAGKTVLKSAIEDTRSSAIAIHDGKVTTPPTSKTEDSFSITSDTIPVGGGDSRYPYPKTENWQKAIGAHFIWIDGAVKVTSDPALKKRQFEIRMTIHMEDMYNFNPGAHDIATGVADAENGRFEITGLGKEFLSKATVGRTIKFSVPFGPLPDTRVQPADEDVSRR
jgi:hypothetical protein